MSANPSVSSPSSRPLVAGGRVRTPESRTGTMTSWSWMLLGYFVVGVSLVSIHSSVLVPNRADKEFVELSMLFDMAATMTTTSEGESSSTTPPPTSVPTYQYNPLLIPTYAPTPMIARTNQSSDGSSSPQSPPPRRRRLEFVHIPKTGGTEVELAAIAANVTWGICHWTSSMYQWSPAKASEAEHTCAHTDPRHPFRKQPYRTPSWHLPPCWLEYHNHERPNPYHDADLFAIVRNPYDRMVSEYRYTQLFKEEKRDTPADLNAHLKSVLTSLLEMARYKAYPCKIPTPMRMIAFDSHYIPQYRYVYAGERRVIQHVLHLEHYLFPNKFEKLMEDYELNVKLVRHQTWDRFPPNASRPKLTRWDLDPEVQRLIQIIYEEDFIRFGYSMKL